MFDLRTALKSNISDLNLDYVGTDVFDGRSTQFALDNMKQYPFDDAAVFIGDCRVRATEPHSFGKNVVTNDAEVIIAANSDTGKAAIEDIANSLRLGIERNNLDEANWLRTSLIEIRQIEKNAQTGIFYQILRFEILAFENTPGIVSPTSFNLPNVQIIDPGLISITGTQDITINFTYSLGDYTADRIDVTAYRTGTGLRAMYAADPSLSGGTASVTFASVGLTDIADAAGTYAYWVRATIRDIYGLSRTQEFAINIQRS